MARNSEDDIRKRYREREEEQNRPTDDPNAPSEDYIKKLVELMERAEPLIHQINGSYNMWMQGVERNPPRDRQAQLDRMMETLTMMAKPTPAYRFKFQNIQATYNMFRQKWERLIADIESGKIVKKNRPGGTITQIKKAA